MSSIIDLPDIKYKKKSDINYLGNCNELFKKKLFPSIESITGVRESNGVIMKGRSAVSEFVLFQLGEKNSGKTDASNTWIEWALDIYGEENVSIYVTRDIFAVTGVFIEDRQQFFGSIIDDKPVQIIIHDDFLSQFGSKASRKELNAFTQIFQNTRHLSKYIDEYNNQRGRFIFIFNAQDYYLANRDTRGTWGARNFKSLQKNKQHHREFRKEMPEKPFKLLEEMTIKIIDEEADQSFKSNNIIDFGFGTFGLVRSKLTEINYCSSSSEYWIKSIDLEELLSEAQSFYEGGSYTTNEPVNRGSISGKFRFVKNYEKDLWDGFLQDAFDWGYENALPSKKYKRDRHWEPLKRFMVDGDNVTTIAEDAGRSNSIFSNSYEKDGWPQILIKEQLGYWIEPFIPKYVDNIKWNVIAGQGKSDLKDDDALASGRPGIGLHGEIKLRRNNKTPHHEWISEEMKAHLQAGGRAYLYMILMRRKKDTAVNRIKEFEVLYDGDMIDIPKVEELIPIAEKNDINSTLELLNTLDIDFESELTW